MRLDVYLVERGYAESRERAKKLIAAGMVQVDGACIDKPSTEVKGEQPLSTSAEVEIFHLTVQKRRKG